jgi:futalosine hydrolase
MENMEGAGSAHVSMHYHIPFLEIRSASNMVGKRDTSLWNLPLAFERASEAVFELVCKLTHHI